MAETLREHGVVLAGPRLRLRPLTEADWDLLLPWNQDPEVLFFADGDDNESHTLPEVQSIYRTVSQHAFTFIMELGGRPIGEGWLQALNLPRLLARHRGEDVRRIDLMIGEKDLWGQGLGSEAIALLTTFGFSQERCDRIYACGVADYNARSRGAFRKCGYELVGVIPERSVKMRYSYDLCQTHGKFTGQRSRPRVLNLVADASLTPQWETLNTRAEVVFAPAEAAVLEAALPDFEVACLPEGLEPPREVLRRVRLLVLESEPTVELEVYCREHGIRVLTTPAAEMGGAVLRRLEGRA